jgi:hypothetical protein
MTDDEVVAEMERRFGAGDTEQYMRLARATRSLVAIWAAYAQTPDGSVAEAFMEQRLNQMLDGMKTRPEHSVGMIESLLALVYHMRLGGTYEDWFQSIGISPEPGGDD